MNSCHANVAAVLAPALSVHSEVVDAGHCAHQIVVAESLLTESLIMA